MTSCRETCCHDCTKQDQCSIDDKCDKNRIKTESCGVQTGNFGHPCLHIKRKEVIDMACGTKKGGKKGGCKGGCKGK